MFDKEDIYYHGSEKRLLSRLSLSFADKDGPFGPAIFLTKVRSIAEYHSGNKGSIYQVKLLGDSELTINLDKNVENQTAKAIRVIERLSREIHHNDTDISSCNARKVIHQINAKNYQESKRESNKFLKENGIWMIYGHLSQNENSGSKDHGVQYAVIDDQYVKISRTE